MELILIVSIIPEINNNSLKGIEIVTSKILIGLEGGSCCHRKLCDWPCECGAHMEVTEKEKMEEGGHSA